MVTGGGGGIGRAVIKAFASEGAKMALIDMDHPESAWLAIGLKSDSVIPIKADVSKIEDVEMAINRMMQCFGHVDIVVNAAGLQHPIGPFAGTDPQVWMKNIETNLFGTMLCCRSVLPIMIARKAGKIINFSGGGATGPRPFFSAYACAKTAVVRFTEVLAEEVRTFGIDVNAIAPGAVNTKMLDEIIEAGSRAGSEECEEAVRRRDTGGVPPDLPAELVVFLASDESDGITGKLISAAWDPWRDQGFRNRLKTDRDFATLRRIDDMNFYSRKQ